MTPYEDLLQTALAELELVLAGRFAEAAELGAAREQLVDALPERPPAEAAPLLAEAERTVRTAIGYTLAAMERTRTALAQLAAGRRALGSYAGAGALALALDRRA